MTQPIEPMRLDEFVKLLRNQSTTVQEGLFKSVQRLRQAILDRYRDHYDAIELTTDVWLQESNLAIQQGLDNLGESRDTTYLGTDSFLLPEGALMVAYGVNHARTGKATYSNVTVYGRELQNGVASVVDLAQHPGGRPVRG